MTDKGLTKLGVFTLCLSIFTFWFIGYAEKVGKERDKVRYANGPVYVETNDIGCNKYRYYKTEFYRCPKDIQEEYQADSFTETHACGKNRCRRDYPVLHENASVQDLEQLTH